jgi:hypothetical protein
VQSRARTNAAELQEMKKGKETIELVIDQVNLETKEEKKCANRMEHGLTTVYNHFLDNTQEENKSTKEKLGLISQTIDQYREEIEEIKEKMTPTNPTELRE